MLKCESLRCLKDECVRVGIGISEIIINIIDEYMTVEGSRLGFLTKLYILR